MNWPGTKSSGWPSSRVKVRCATDGASMRLPMSLSGNWTMAKTGMGRSGPGAGRSGAYTSGSPRNAAKANAMIPASDTAPGAPALRIRDLRKTYDNGVQALKGVSLDVHPGDFYALLGPNGAGKSTLIGIVSSLVNKTAGEVSLFGVDLHAQRAAAMRLMGLVPQELNFNFFEKPLDILVNYAGFYGIPRAQALVRAEEELKRALLWDKARTMARTLSGGMKRRLMIARAMMTRPRLLILDEPTAGVDI